MMCTLTAPFPHGVPPLNADDERAGRHNVTESPTSCSLLRPKKNADHRAIPSSGWQKSSSERISHRAIASLPTFPEAECGLMHLDTPFLTNLCCCSPAMDPPKTGDPR